MMKKMTNTSVKNSYFGKTNTPCCHKNWTGENHTTGVKKICRYHTVGKILWKSEDSGKKGAEAAKYASLNDLLQNQGNNETLSQFET